jgi:hypothetical protein
MICSCCHKDGELGDPSKLQAYLYQTEDGHIIFICPPCIVRIIADYMARQNNIVIAQPSMPVEPAIRKIELD